MFLKFFIVTVIFSGTLWYLHEFHTAQFMAVTRNIPYLSPMMARLHSSTSSGKKDKPDETAKRLFTVDELSQYNGEEGSKGIYVAILGKVFDVQKGEKHYRPGGTYHVFAGRDASKAFVTGDFSDSEASDDVNDLPLSDILSLKHWQEFYEKDYVNKGKLVGTYYTSSGDKTEYHKKFDEILEIAQAEKSGGEMKKKSFPPCNVEWTAEKGSRVWCTPRSGGITRDWAGVPRKLYEVGTTKHSCVCINLPELENPESPQFPRRKNLEAYASCQPEATSCSYKT